MTPIMYEQNASMYMFNWPLLSLPWQCIAQHSVGMLVNVTVQELYSYCCHLQEQKIYLDNHGPDNSSVQ
jgi:hypothetical protein